MRATIKCYFILLAISIFYITGINAQDTLIQSGATWKYLDDGSNQGTAWTPIGFNDASWSSGPAQLGYGDGDEATVISYGGNSSNKYITYYFRKSFSVANPATINALELQMLRDDGAVAYLNGTEVARTNMPSGTITYTTTASSAIGGSAENTFYTFTVDPSLLVTGTNVLAVEVHQANATSSDLSFDAYLIGTNPSITRGPYLQMAGPDRMVVRWRTNVATASKVKYGLSFGSQTSVVTNSTDTVDHEITITGLSAETTYYYSVGYDTVWLKGEDAVHQFTTAPTIGTRTPTRFWVLGDAGTGTTNQKNVRDAFYNYTSGTYTNAMLFLGDNAYNSGTDAEYQANLFDIYDSIMLKTAAFSCPGNHEFYNGNTASATQTGPFYENFTLPTAAELGGLASGTEAYYSFDYGNIHFISLDSHDSPRGTSGAMLTWLTNDLSATNQEWIIVIFHHPPYSKGSHDSDTETQLVEMRQNALPILEQYGVDLVLSGHSHSYERSYFINGHYGVSSTFNSSTMGVDMGSGNINTSCAYRKESVGVDAGKGAVYITSGSAGKVSGGALNHAAMRVNLNLLGSVILDVDSNRLDVRFIDDAGSIQDYFTILKDESVQTDTTIISGQPITLTASWTGSYTWSTGATTQSITVSPTSTTSYTVEDPSTCKRDFFNINISTGNQKPVAINDKAITTKNSSIAINVLNNDLDPEGGIDPTTVSIISPVSNGSTSINTSTGVITYTPNSNYLGDDMFTYVVSDDGLPVPPVMKDTATVYIIVNMNSVLIGKDSILGNVYMDANLDGVYTAADFAVGAIGVNIYQDTDNNDSVNTGDVLTTSLISASDGSFSTVVNAPGINDLTLQINASANDATEDESGNVTLSDSELFVGNKPSDFNTPPNGNFITAGSSWKYLDDGSNQGTAWTAIGFDDSGWSSGNAQLGYGDGDEATVISYGGNSSNKYITYYFRQSFTVTNVSDFGSLDLEVIRDDGAVVYLNGTEVFRTNMPSGTITYTTTASSAIGGASESTWYTTTVDTSLLVAGTNVLSIEIHQANATSSDLSFDCKLTGVSASGTTLISSGDSWKYLDNGSNQGKDWRSPNFDDAGWSTGTAQLGYGDGDETTTISFGGNSSNKYITTYFRKEINVTNPASYEFLKLQLLRDDGAIVYVNGAEVVRSNLAEGNITYLTYADSAIALTNESTFYTYYINADVLKSGTNTIAVEIHQINATSSDLSFDMILEAMGGTAQTIGMRFMNVTIPGSGTIEDARFKLVASDDVPAGSYFVIKVEESDNAPVFSNSSNNITSRSMVSDSVVWYLPEFVPVGDTITGPSMNDLVQAILNRSGWNSGNSMVFTISGIGLRRIFSYDSSAAFAPMLYLAYNSGSGSSMNYVMELDTNDLPAGYRLAESKYQTADFTGSAQSDSGNDLGYVGVSTTCYAVGDGQNTISTDVTFHIINRKSGTNFKIGNMYTESIETIAWNKNGDTLFAMAYATLGFIDINTGSFTAIGTSSSQASGTDGNITVDDIDGLTFDHTNNTLYGALRRTGANGALFKFNRNTGAFIPNAFGSNDYVLISGSGIAYYIDDIAVDPTNGNMYAVNNDDASLSQLISVNKTTGAATVIGALGVTDMEGQGFSSDGTFYGSTGNSSTDSTKSDMFWEIDISNGDTTRIVKFNSGTDFESCDCITNNPKNLLYGTVFNDIDSNGVMDGLDTGIANIKVYLYQDVNGDGIINAGDVLTDSMLTNTNGDYSFLVSSTGDFLTSTVLSTLPGGSVLTTDNLEAADFTTLGQTDPNNNFGFNFPNGYVLPLDLLLFEVEARGDDAYLFWKTINEIGTSHFLVERSRDGKTFKSIGTVKTNNIKSSVNFYDFTDENPPLGMVYYRLKMYDLDGKFAFSSIRNVYFGMVGSVINVTGYPNPTNGNYNLNIQSEKDEWINMRLYNQTGKLMLEKKISLESGAVNTSISMDGMGHGTYVIKLVGSSGSLEIMKVVKVQ
jgi:calcineurin-like phosphoesterase family protein/Big-like domain-containing protein/purple acid phosphatase-like protein/type IX secretion system substrate protein